MNIPPIYPRLFFKSYIIDTYLGNKNMTSMVARLLFKPHTIEKINVYGYGNAEKGGACPLYIQISGGGDAWANRNKFYKTGLKEKYGI